MLEQFLLKHFQIITLPNYRWDLAKSYFQVASKKFPTQFKCNTIVKISKAMLWLEGVKSPKPARKYNTKRKGIILIVRAQLRFKSLYPQKRLQPSRLLKLLDVVEEYPRHLQTRTPNNYGKFEDTSRFWFPRRGYRKREITMTWGAILTQYTGNPV